MGVYLNAGFVHSQSHCLTRSCQAIAMHSGKLVKLPANFPFTQRRRPTVQEKLYVTETDLLHDAYRLGVQIAESGFRPTFIVGLM